MKVVKINEAGKWADKPYEPQFNVEVGDEVPVGSGTKVGEDGKPTCLSHEIAEIMVNAGRGEYGNVKETKADAEKGNSKPKAEGNAAAKDKGDSEKSGGK